MPLGTVGVARFGGFVDVFLEFFWGFGGRSMSGLLVLLVLVCFLGGLAF